MFIFLYQGSLLYDHFFNKPTSALVWFVGIILAAHGHPGPFVTDCDPSAALMVQGLTGCVWWGILWESSGIHPMAKCIRDGKVAVIFSFNDRWSLMDCDGNEDFLLHDDVLVSLIEARQFDEIPEFVSKQFPESDFWWLDNSDRLEGLIIKWVPIGTKFRVVSLVDGMGEMVEILNINHWKTA